MFAMPFPLRQMYRVSVCIRSVHHMCVGKEIATENPYPYMDERIGATPIVRCAHHNNNDASTRMTGAKIYQKHGWIYTENGLRNFEHKSFWHTTTIVEPTVRRTLGCYFQPETVKLSVSFDEKQTISKARLCQKFLLLRHTKLIDMVFGGSSSLNCVRT